MASILIPGFLKWDGFKYVLDPDVEGAQGPQGPPGTLGPAGGDLTGDFPDPVVAQSTSDIFTVVGPEILFQGGIDGNGNPLPATDSLRAGIRTTDATANQVLNTIIPSDGQIIRVISEVSAVRDDAPGEAAWFLLKGVWIRSGGSLVVIKAPEVVDSGFTEGASTWTAQLAASGITILTQVTGQVGKTINWSLVREWIRGS